MFLLIVIEPVQAFLLVFVGRSVNIYCLYLVCHLCLLPCSNSVARKAGKRRVQILFLGLFIVVRFHGILGVCGTLRSSLKCSAMLQQNFTSESF